MAKKKKVPEMKAPCAASSKSSNGLAHNAEESCVMDNHPPFDEGWSKPVDIVDDMGFSLPGSPEAFYDLARKIQTDVTALCMALKSADNSPPIEQKRRAYEVVAVMKQRLQHLEKSIALTVTPLVHKVSSSSSLEPPV